MSLLDYFWDSGRKCFPAAVPRKRIGISGWEYISGEVPTCAAWVQGNAPGHLAIRVLCYLLHGSHSLTVQTRDSAAYALRVAEQTLIIGQNEHIIGQTDHIISEHNLEKYFGVQSEMIRSSKNGSTVSVISLYPIRTYSHILLLDEEEVGG